MKRLKYAIIGYPVEHSLSPQMHEAGFRAAQIEAGYHRIPVKSAELCERITYLKQNDYAGWNVTYPLKEKIIPYLDRITPAALNIGAVNTVKNDNGLLLGDNTDGSGFVESLTAQGFDFQGKKVVILGAGGSAKAIAAALVNKDVQMYILNRDYERAKDLVSQIIVLGGSASAGNFAAVDWLASVDLLIQTTPVGMKGERYPFSLEGIHLKSWVVDLIYNPIATSFLTEAKSYGCHTMNGLNMLLYQGALAWKFWFDLEAPIPVMREVLLGASI